MMGIIKYFFLIGVCFVIFEFIWGILKFIFNALTRSIASPTTDKIVRIVRFALFTTVLVQFTHIINLEQNLIHSSTAGIVMATIVISLYLLGKYQNKASFAKVKGLDQIMKGFSSPFNPKLEKILIFSAIAVFIIGSIYPDMFKNTITSWYTDSILNIYDTPFFGFIFKVIAVFVLVNTFSRGAKIIGKLVAGQSFTEATKNDKNMFNYFNNRNGGEDTNTRSEEVEFTEFEDVTDEK